MRCKCSRYSSGCSYIYHKVRPIVSATLQLCSNFALMLNCRLPGFLCQNELESKPIKRIINAAIYFYMNMHFNFHNNKKLWQLDTNINFKWLKSCVYIRLCCCMLVVWTKGNVQKSIAARKTKTCSEFIQSEILRSLQDVYDYGTLTLSDVSICTVSSWVGTCFILRVQGISFEPKSLLLVYRQAAFMVPICTWILYIHQLIDRIIVKKLNTKQM